LFKNWTYNYVTNLGTYSIEAARGNFRPLLMSMAGSGAVGGAVGMPFFGAASGLSEFLTDKDLVEWTYELMGNDVGEEGSPFVADSLLYGFPSWFGVSVQGRAAAPASDILRDTSMMFNTVHAERARGLGELWNAGTSMAGRGMNPYDSERFTRGAVRAFLPRTLQRMYASTAKDGLISLQTGNRIMPSPTGFAALSHWLGLTPLEVEKQMDAHNELYEDTNKIRERLSFYGALGADAILSRRYDLLTEITRKAAGEGLMLDSLANSIQTRIGKQTSDQRDRQWDLFTQGRMMRQRGL
jgi:hypothetical protein